MSYRAFGGLLFLSISVACSSGSSSPDYAGLPECPKCNAEPTGGSSSPTTGAGEGGSSGSGGTTSAGATGGTTVSTVGERVAGQVVEFQDDTLSAPTIYIASAVTITAASPDTNMPTATAVSSAGAYTLNDVAQGLQWFRSQPASTATDIFGVLAPFTVPASTATFNVPVVARGALSPVFALLPSNTQADPNASQVIVQVVNAAGQPVTGVTVTPSFAYAGGKPLYDSGSGYVLGGTTHARGIAMFLNATSSGAVDSITITVNGSASAPIAVRLALDTVSLIAVSTP
jgi:hypothetical protein